MDHSTLQKNSLHTTEASKESLPPVLGRIHSLESFGTVDGPGIRFVIFFQGCPMRCLYCHNPDSWKMAGGSLMTAEEILTRFERNRSFYRDGGITATGGEPMMQMNFLIDLFTKAKTKAIHTCLDTSGIVFPPDFDHPIYQKIEQLMEVTDLVMLDIKHINDSDHQNLTGKSNRSILAFAKYLHRIRKPVWIRHVVVPGITYQEEALKKLGHFLGSLGNIQKLEILPYHTMGKEKYEKLGYKYKLMNTPELTKEQALQAEQIIKKAMGTSQQEL